MNKIFKVVWSKTKECYVVVSEVAKNNGGKKKVLASVLAGLAMVGAGAQVQAYSALGGHDNPAIETLAVGPDTLANQEAAVAVGMHNNANGQPAGKYSVAIGSFSNANGEISIAMGGVTNASGKMSVAVGYRASATDEAAVALGNMVSADKNSTGVGPGATASGTYAFAGGYQSETTGISGVAIGDNAKAKAARAMAIGGHAEATAEQAIAIGSDTGAGNKTTASKKNAIAVGHGATASGLDTAAIGTSATASGQSSVALGNGTQSTHLNTTAIGSNVQSTKTGSIGIGGNVESIGDYSVAIGSASAGKTVKAVDYATAVGGLSNAAERAAALGAGANAAQARSVAVGYKATANTADGVAIGSTSVASTAAGVQGFDSAENRTRKYTNLTGNVQTSTLAAVSVGDGTTVTRQITGLAAGKEDTDAVNVAQLKNVGVRVGADTNTATIGTNKVAADFLAYNGQLNIKGDSNRVTTVSENDANGKDANVNIKFDYDGLVKAKTGSAVTVDQKTDAAGKTYFEIDAAAGSKTVVADGKNTTVTGAGTTASPYKVNVEGALTGISSITNNGGGKIEFTTGGTTISGGPVNVSNNKITGVANGDVNATSTDAVNGSQLHAVKAAERHIAPTTTGHEYTVDSNGDVTMTYLDGNNNAVANEKAVIKGIAKQDLSNITNEGKKEITKLGTIVNAGDNVTVTSSSDATTGRTTYTVNAVTPAIYTDKNGNKVVKRPDGTYTTNLDGSTGNDVAANDVIVSFKDAAGNTTGGSSIVNNVGSAIKNQTGATYLDKLDAAAGDTKTQNAAVNVTDLKNTADGLTNKGLRFDANEGNEKTNKLGSKVTVKGTGALTAGKAYADEYNTANIRTNIEQGTDGNTTINVGLAKELKAINSISNGGSSITISNVPTGATTPAVTISGGNLSMGNGTTNNKIVNLAPGTGDNDAVNVKQLKDTELHITPGTYTPGADKKVKLTYTDGNNTVVNGKEAVIDLSGLATGGTTSTEKVQKAADATDDKNIAEVGPKSGDTFGAANATYEVSVSRNAVKDAAREAVTINNGGTKSGTTYTPNADNPITVTPKEDAANHNTTYEVTFDGNKAAKQIPLTYKATNGTTTTADQTVKLDKGLNFTGGDYTTASVGADGKVTFDVNLGTAPTVTDGKPGVPGQAGAAGKDGIATVKTVVDTINNSGWKANAKANGGTLDGSSTATVVKPGDQVNFAAGKNLTVKQDLTGEHTYTYSLNKDLKDLTSVEIGGSTIKTDGDHITITSPDTTTGATPGATVTNKVANLGDEKHIKPDTYAVATDGSVTLKYVDGNSKDLTETTKITGITNQNLSNISTAGETKIKNLAKSAINMEDGKNTKASKRDVNGVDTYKVDVEGDLTGISSITNGGTNNGKISFGPNKTVTVDGDHSITLNASTGKIGGLQNLTFDPTNITSGQAATEDQLKSVHDTLKANERHIAPTTVATGSTETKGGTANAGGTANVYKYDAASKTVTLTYNDGNGNAVTDTKAVIDFSALNTGGTTASTWDIKSSADTANGGATATGHEVNAKTIANTNSVEMIAGKNLTVKQTSDTNGAKVEFALSDEITVGKDGANGVDGKIGVNGKDGASVVINGKDGSIGLTGPRGATGAPGASATLNVKDGVPGVDGAPGTNLTRIVYTDKNNVEHEVATHDDGMKFAGDDGQANQATNANVIKKHLNNVVDIIGGATKADLTTNNIGVNNDGNGKLLVQLSKNLKDINTVKNGNTTITLNDAPGGATNTPAVTISGGNLSVGGNKVTNVDDGTDNNDAVNVKQLKAAKTEVKAGKNVVVTSETSTTDGHTTYTVNASTPVVYTTPDGTTKLIKQPDGTFKDESGNVYNGPVIASFEDGTGARTGGNMIVNNVGSAINNHATPGVTSPTYLDKLDAAAGDNNTKNAAVNVTDLKNTKDGLIDKGLKFNANEGGVKTNKLGSTVTVQGSGALTAGKAYADEYNTANIRTNISQSNGDTVINVGLAKALKDINSISNGGSSITLNSTPGGATNTPAVQITGGNLSMGDGTANGNNKIVNLAPGTADTDAVNVKQLKDTELHITPGTYTPGADKKVKLTYTDGNNQLVTGKEAVIDLSGLSPGGATASTWNVKSSANTTDGGAVGATHDANAQNIANGKTVEFQSGKNLVVNQTNDTTNGNATVEFSLSDNITVGKDGANGKDGSVGAKGADGSAVVMNGKDGSIGLNGTNGANGISIKGKDGANGVGIDGKDGVTRIVYTEKVPDPANPGTTKEVTHEVATMDDGLKFTGNNTGTVNKHKLGSLVKVQGEGVSATDEAAFVSASGNIAVTAENNDTLTIRLNKNLKGLNSIQLGGNTIQSNGDNITFTTNGGTTKTVATTDQLWTIQANGTDVPAKSGKVNLVAGDHITITPDAANGKMTISATGFGSMDGFNVKTSAESATVGTHAGDTTENIKNGKTIDMQAGKNLVVTQSNDGNGNTTVNYALNKDVDLGTTGSLKTGDTKITDNGLTINNGPSITKTGVDAGDKKITNVADGAVNATSKDAVNGSQLKKYTDAAKTTVEAGDNNVKVDADNTAADGHTNYKVSLNPVVTIGDTHKVKIDGHTGDITGLTNVTIPTTPGSDFATKGRAATEEQLKQVLDEAKNKAIEKVQAGTAAAGDTNIAKVAPKAGDTFGTAGATYEVSVSKNDVKDAAKEAVKVTSVSPAITVTADTSVAHETTYKVGFDGNQAATQIPLTYKQNGGNTRTVKLSDGLNFIDGTNTKARTAADGKVTFDVMGDLTGITSISNAAGGPKMTFGGNSINVTNGDLNMGGNKITNLAPGKDKTDAATVGQLTKVTSNNHSVVINKTTDADGAPVYDLAVTGTPGAPAADPRVDMLGEEIGRVGAQGAALSALKPIQYDPLEPTQIMAGYGNYRGNSALALGVAHYKNESTLIHGGVSWAGGSSHMMANAGVTWKVGNRDSEAAVADRYRKGPISSAYAMQQEMASVKAQNAGLKTEVSDLKAENEQMKAQIAAMMAKLGM